jgi:transcriptional regulator with XRE-family HTH domain
MGAPSLQEDLGRQLIVFRKRAGLTQQQAAARLEMSDGDYNNLERGATNAKTQTWQHAFEELGGPGCWNEFMRPPEVVYPKRPGRPPKR